MTRPILSAAILFCAAAAQNDGPREPLCRAALEGDVPQLRALLARGVSPNVRDDQGETPLMRAASTHSTLVPDDRKNLPRDPVACARLLLDRHADVNARDPAGRTALLIAMQGSASEYGVTGADEPLARLLVDRGADLRVQDNEGWSPLLMALNLWADQPALLQLLLSKGADVNARLKDGRSGLMLAAHLGKDDRLPLLVAKGADVNAHDHSGATVLMTAAAVQWDEQAFAMMKLLLAKGANPNAADNQGRTAADRVAQAGYLDRARLLLESGTRVADADAFWKRARNYALLRAIAGGTVETAAVLLTQGADPDFRDDAGRTLLTIAAADEYSADRTRLLLEHGASVNLPAANGDTALMVAADRYQAETAGTLLDGGANPNTVDHDGNSVLMRAAASKHSWEEERKPLIGLLLKKGADPAARNGRGVTALMLLALNGNPALKLLLDKPVDVDARDEDGNTALLYAARYFVREWQRRNGRELLQKGANVNAANHAGETALILAATQFEGDAARLLLEKGAAVNSRTNAGRTALMQAIDGPKDFDNDRHVVYSPQIARLLIAAGADVNMRDSGGDTALSLAGKRGYQEMAAALEQAGAKR